MMKELSYRSPVTQCERDAVQAAALALAERRHHAEPHVLDYFDAVHKLHGGGVIRTRHVRLVPGAEGVVLG